MPRFVKRRSDRGFSMFFLWCLMVSWGFLFVVFFFFFVLGVDCVDVFLRI